MDLQTQTAIETQGVSNAQTQTSKLLSQVKAQRKLAQYSMVQEANFKPSFDKEGNFVEFANDDGTLMSNEDIISTLDGTVPYQLMLVDSMGNSTKSMVYLDKKRIIRLGCTEPMDLVDKYVKLEEFIIVKKGQAYPKDWFPDNKEHAKKPIVAKRTRTYAQDITILTKKAVKMLKNSI